MAVAVAGLYLQVVGHMLKWHSHISAPDLHKIMSEKNAESKKDAHLPVDLIKNEENAVGGGPVGRDDKGAAEEHVFHEIADAGELALDAGGHQHILRGFTYLKLEEGTFSLHYNEGLWCHQYSIIIEDVMPKGFQDE